MPMPGGLIDDDEQHVRPEQQQQEGKGVAGATENLQHVKYGIFKALFQKLSPVNEGVLQVRGVLNALDLRSAVLRVAVQAAPFSAVPLIVFATHGSREFT
jgi:hypothetical protein